MSGSIAVRNVVLQSVSRVFSQLKSKVLRRKADSVTPKFVTKSVYTSVKTGPLRATYRFTRYFECTVQWLMVTVAAAIALLLLKLFVNAFTNEPSAVAAYAAPISFNNPQSQDGAANQDSGGNTSAVEFTAMPFPGTTAPAQSAAQNQGQAQAPASAPNAAATPQGAPTLIEMPSFNMPAPAPAPATTPAPAPAPAQNQGTSTNAAPASPAAPSAPAAAGGSAANIAAGLLDDESDENDGEKAQSQTQASAPAPAPAPDLQPVTRPAQPQAQPAPPRPQTPAPSQANTQKPMQSIPVNPNLTGDTSKLGQEKATTTIELKPFAIHTESSVALHKEEVLLDSSKAPAKTQNPPQSFPGLGVGNAKIQNPASASASASSGSGAVAQGGTSQGQQGAQSAAAAASGSKKEMSASVFIPQGKAAEAAAGQASSYTAIPMQLNSQSLQEAWQEQNAATTATSGVNNKTPAKSAFSSQSNSNFNAAFDQKEGSTPNYTQHDLGSLSGSAAATAQPSQQASGGAPNSAANQGRQQGGQGGSVQSAQSGQSAQAAGAGAAQATGSGVAAGGGAAGTAGDGTGTAATHPVGGTAKDKYPYPSTLIDPTKIHANAPAKPVETEEVLANQSIVVPEVSIASVIMDGLIYLVGFWRVLSLYCIYHCGQGVVINFRKRLITIYHNWMVEEIVMTDVERIDVVAPAEMTLSRRHLQRLLPYVNIDGIQITYATTNDEDEVPDYKTTLIKGYSSDQLQKMFDVLNQIY